MTASTDRVPIPLCPACAVAAGQDTRVDEAPEAALCAWCGVVRTTLRAVVVPTPLVLVPESAAS